MSFKKKRSYGPLLCKKKCVILSFPRQIRQNNLSRYASLLSKFYKLICDSSPGAAEGVQYAQTLTTAIRQKSPEDQIINILKDIPNPLLMEASGDIEPRCNPLQIDVFVQTLLFLGSKSFTHSFVAINRYYEVLKVRRADERFPPLSTYITIFSFVVVSRKRRSTIVRTTQYIRIMAYSSSNAGRSD